MDMATAIVAPSNDPNANSQELWIKIYAFIIRTFINYNYLMRADSPYVLRRATLYNVKHKKILTSSKAPRICGILSTEGPCSIYPYHMISRARVPDCITRRLH